MIKTVDNFVLENFCGDGNISQKINEKYFFENTNANDIKNSITISLKDFKQNGNNILSLLSCKSTNEDDLIFSLNCFKNEKNEKVFNIKTGNYVGKFHFNNIEININSRFSNYFLKRMLNFANNVFLDDVDVSGETKKSKDFDYSKFIIYYMFTQKLEKAFLLGLPKTYTTVKHHNFKLKGSIDINNFIKYDIPFIGKISSKNREQKEIQPIIDILYKALSIIEKTMPGFLKNIQHIKTYLKQHKSKKQITDETFQKALKSKALNNPIYSQYKKILEYSKFIIKSGIIQHNKKGYEKSFGFLVNIAELFEVYIYKLLKNNFVDWKVLHEEAIELYNDSFFKRKIIPDIVMKKDDSILVFDTKYKKMIFTPGIGDGQRGDLDRHDFFQIHTYVSYYQNNKYKFNVIAGGLLYPLEQKQQTNISYSNNFLGNNNTKFIVDGIFVNAKDLTIEKIKENEDRFIKRIRNLINN